MQPFGAGLALHHELTIVLEAVADTTRAFIGANTASGRRCEYTRICGACRREATGEVTGIGVIGSRLLLLLLILLLLLLLLNGAELSDID